MTVIEPNTLGLSWCEFDPNNSDLRKMSLSLAQICLGWIQDGLARNFFFFFKRKLKDNEKF